MVDYDDNISAIGRCSIELACINIIGDFKCVRESKCMTITYIILWFIKLIELIFRSLDLLLDIPHE